MTKTFVGSRLRPGCEASAASKSGCTRADAGDLTELSLNQIEHDVRPLTVAVLLRITEVFGVDATSSPPRTTPASPLNSARSLHRPRPGLNVDLTEIAELVGAHPAMARAMVNLHRRYRITTIAAPAAATGRTIQYRPAGSGTGSTSMPGRCGTTTNDRITCTNSTPPQRI